MSINRAQPRHSVRPSLLLHFAKTKTLDPRIDFTRASTASYYDGKTYAKAEENLFDYSEDLSKPNWFVTGGTASQNDTTAPNGETTADKFTENTAGGEHKVARGGSDPIIAVGGTYTLSIYLKNNSGTRNVGFRGFGNGGAGEFPIFNIVSGTIVDSGTEWTNVSITDVGNSWYRCVATTTATTTIGAIFQVLDGSTQNYTGDGSSSIFFWGAQLEQRDFVTAYTPTTDQPITNYIPALQTASAGEARFDHDPVTEESLGLLIEEQRTNLLARSEEFDNAFWTKNNSSITADTIVAPDGTLTGDKFVEDTTSNTHQLVKTVTGLSSVFYTYSVFVKPAERTSISLNGSAAFNYFAIFNLQTKQVTSTNADSTRIEDYGNGWLRCSITGEADTSSQSFSSLLIRLIVNGQSSYTSDGFSGVYLWGAQLEEGSFPTSYIPTSGSQVTRNSDNAEMTGTNFSSWYRADEGTIYAEANTYSVSVDNHRIFAISDNSAQNRIYMRAGLTRTFFIEKNNTEWTNLDAGDFTDNVFSKVAGAYRTNDIAVTLNSGAVKTDSSGLIPSVNRIYIGAYSAGNNLHLNGHIKKLAYYPVRLTNEELQRLTED